MTSERVCPVCDEPVSPEEGIYRFGDTDYHRECYEKRQATDRREATERRAAEDRRASEERGS
jgi:hypothetical protein